MTSPTKRIDLQKDTTLFGQLTSIQKHTTNLNKQMIDQLQQINRLKNQVAGLAKEGKQSSQETKGKLVEEIKKFEQKIKGFLIGQKAQYVRLSNQINGMIQNSKELNAQLQILGGKFDEFQKNVGL